MKSSVLDRLEQRILDEAIRDDNFDCQKLEYHTIDAHEVLS
jgi:hypothetical protein